MLVAEALDVVGLVQAEFSLPGRFPVKPLLILLHLVGGGLLLERTKQFLKLLRCLFLRVILLEIFKRSLYRLVRRR